MTTEFDPTTLPLPIDTPLVIVTLEPIHTFSSIFIEEEVINLLKFWGKVVRREFYQ